LSSFHADGGRGQSILRFPKATNSWAVMTPAQCRAARGLLDWTQDKLCEAAQVGGPTLRNFENGMIMPRRASLAAIKRALEEAGVEFIDNGGRSRRTTGEAAWGVVGKRPTKSSQFEIIFTS
jgi:transcriptional regulator with XRE-family HTH domain